MAKTGRPPTPDDEQTVVVRLYKRHVEILDAAIRELRTTRRELQTATVRGLDTATITALDKPHPADRRDMLGELIEESLVFERLFPTRVGIRVNQMDDIGEQVETQCWINSKQQELTQDAPACVQRQLLRHQLRHLERDSPERYQEEVAGLFRRLKGVR